MAVPAGDPAVLAAEFTESASQLGAGRVPGILWPLCTRCWPAIRREVADLRQRGRARAGRGAGAAAGNGRVLITSRNALWPLGQGLEVPVLDLDAAAGFLTAPATRTPRRRGLAEAVGGLPLALEQAAAYTEATGGSLVDYLAMFSRRRAELLGRGQVAGYGGTVAAAWSLAFTQLEQSDPGRPGCCGCWRSAPPKPSVGTAAATPVRAERGAEPGGGAGAGALLEDELAAADAVAALRRYSLARPAGDETVSVNRLVQAVTADQMPEELRDAWRQAAAAVIEAAVSMKSEQPETWPASKLCCRRPSGPGPDQRWPVADRAVPRGERHLRRGPRPVAADR